MEKGDNWLIAKKPLEGYKCGSCESYIGGDLPDKGQYIAWNKIQQKKDSMDKNYNVRIYLYRLETGFLEWSK
jgi:hypothetical protein